MKKLKGLLENKVFKIFYNIIKIFIVGLLILYLSFIIIQNLTHNSSIMGYKVFTVATGSMIPVYNVNDVIIVKDIKADKVKVGDDLAYIGRDPSNEGLIITHRLVSIEVLDDGNTYYQMKGVNNEVGDPLIVGDQIIGKVQRKIYSIGFINHVIKNMYGFFFLVFCPLVLVIFLEIADTIIDMKVEKNELVLHSDKENSSENISVDDTIKEETKKVGEVVETVGESDEEVI